MSLRKLIETLEFICLIISFKAKWDGWEDTCFEPVGHPHMHTSRKVCICIHSQWLHCLNALLLYSIYVPPLTLLCKEPMSDPLHIVDQNKGASQRRIHCFNHLLTVSFYIPVVVATSSSVFLQRTPGTRRTSYFCSALLLDGVCLPMDLRQYQYWFGVHVHTYILTLYTYILPCIDMAFMTYHAHTYSHTHIHSDIHTCIHTHIHTYIHTYIQTYIYTYIRTYIHTHIHTYMRT